ncbi:MAG: SDR family oxidoreductase [Planctomycetota bacterium]
MTTKTVLITGCSSGIGKLAAQTFHARGWNVAATMRTPERETELTQLDRMLVTQLDVTDASSIQHAVDATVSKFGQIDALVNNAGYGGFALFEQESDDSARALFDTNVFGLMNVTQAILPAMRHRGDGTIINITSMAGLLGFPTASVYVASKHAVEGLTESLALEYEPFGVRFRTVAPGAYPTTRFGENTHDFLGAGDEQLVAHAASLREHIDSLVQTMTMQSGSPADPQEVADKIYDCATTDMPVHNPVGADATNLYSMMGGDGRQDFVNHLKQMVMPHQTA